MSYSRPLSVGTTIAERYRVEEVLGEGAAATVYRAHDLTHDREVAIKVLRPEVAAAVGGDRFKREISLSARLSHPHIVPMLDAGETHGMLFYVMPVIGGKSLRERLAVEHQLPVEEAIQIVRDVAIALDHAHAQGIVHRDIKPDNVLLGGGTAVVTDFGIAKMLGERSSGDSLTRTGMAVGTVLYMSPEQASAGLVDARTDIYALGCLAYEMLAGEPPFMGPTPQSILAKHFTDPVPQVHRLRPTVPAAIDDAIATAMAKAPADRYPTAMAFASALTTARATATLGRLPAVEPPVLLPRAPRPQSRRSRALWLGAAGITVVAAGSILTFRDRLFTPEVHADSARRSIAVLPFEDVSRARTRNTSARGSPTSCSVHCRDCRTCVSRPAHRRSPCVAATLPGDIGRRLRVSLPHGKRPPQRANGCGWSPNWWTSAPIPSSGTASSTGRRATCSGYRKTSPAPSPASSRRR
jgi:serine/threonine-protein kinase